MTEQAIDSGRGRPIDLEPSADGVFAVEVNGPTFGVLRRVTASVASGITFGAVAAQPGGRRAYVVSRSTGDVVAEVTERFGDDDSDVDALLHDHAWLSARAFVTRWVP